MEELFRLVRDENDIDKALSMIRSGYMLEPSYKDPIQLQSLVPCRLSEKPGAGQNTGGKRL